MENSKNMIYYMLEYYAETADARFLHQFDMHNISSTVQSVFQQKIKFIKTEA